LLARPQPFPSGASLDSVSWLANNYGSLTTHLLGASCAAERANFRIRTAAFPDLGEAVHFAPSAASGMTR
jgi:hypothetical protein